MSDDKSYCVFPPRKTLTIPLPFGGALAPILDASRPQTDCAVIHSLMLQLSPMLGGMACMLNVLGVIQALKDAVSSPPLDFQNLITKIGKLIDCFRFLDPCELAKMVSSIICMLLAYINCIIDAFESIMKFQVTIDLDAAAGNPVLIANLTCAQDRAQAAAKDAMDSMEGMMPLIDLVNTVSSIVGLPKIDTSKFSTPTPGQLLGGEDPLAPIKDVRDALRTTYELLAETFPGCVSAC